MKAIILAAGIGSRLRPLTDNTPKPLLLICGVPLLELHLVMLADAGVSDILVNTHHLHEQIDDFVAKYKESNPKANIQTVFESELLGSAGTVCMAKDFIGTDEEILVVYGDVLADIDYKKLINAHHAGGAFATIAVKHFDNILGKGVVEVSENGLVSRFLEKPAVHETESRLTNAGFYVLGKSALAAFDPEFTRPYDFGHDFFPKLLAKGDPIGVYKMSERVLDIGTPDSYAAAQRWYL